MTKASWRGRMAVVHPSCQPSLAGTESLPVPPALLPPIFRDPMEPNPLHALGGAFTIQAYEDRQGGARP